MRRQGFTIVELLTVMSVIAILIGLLVPALNLVKDAANQIQQGAQFHSIGVALDLYKAEFGEYPPSNDNIDEYDPANNATVRIGNQTRTDQNYYCGANKLAEALVGLDFLGFHPKSQFWSTGEGKVVNLQTGQEAFVQVYDAVNGIPAINQTADENVKARGGKSGGPFIELENANAFRMQDVYTDTPGFNANSVVLCDSYARKRNALSGSRKTGMPILYYRARSQYVQQDINDPLDIQNDIYYYPDNWHLLNLGTAEQTPQRHPLARQTTVTALQNLEAFEEMVVNPQVVEAAGIKRPYRAGSYILISAGKDGLYGTADDITNFDKRE